MESMPETDPGGGGVSTEFRRGPQHLTLFKTKIAFHSAILFKIKDPDSF